MREIEFRGQTNSGNWIKGSLVYSKNIQPAIYFEVGEGSVKKLDWVCVNSETIGQYIGKKDIKDTPIYEGDIFKFKYMEELNKSIELIGSFCWNDQDLCYEIDIYSPEHPEYVCLNYIDNGQMYDFEIIGNKIDNPDLLK